MNYLQFISENPWLTFFLCLLVATLIQVMWGSLMRCLMVRKRGWPPTHLDTDGEFKTEGDDE